MSTFWKKRWFLVVGLGLFIFFCTLIFTKQSINRTPHKTFSVITFNKSAIYSVSSGDILTGKGIPNASIVLTLSPKGETKEIKTDAKGKWNYTINSSLSPRMYHLTIVMQDKNKKLASIKTYIVQISNTKNNHLTQGIFVNPVEASSDCQYEQKSFAYECAARSDGQLEMCYNDYYRGPGTFCKYQIKINENGLHYHCDEVASCSISCRDEHEEFEICKANGQKCIEKYARSSQTQCLWKQEETCTADASCVIISNYYNISLKRLEFAQNTLANLWLRQMHAQGVYPIDELGEVVLWNKQDYQQWCLAAQTSCSELTDTLPTSEELYNRIFNDKIFISQLMQALYSAPDGGYNPFTVLETYLGEDEFNRVLSILDLNRALIDRSSVNQNTKHQTIEPGKLEEIMKQVIDENGHQEAALLTGTSDPARLLITTTDPIFSSRALTKMLLLGREATLGDKIQGVLGLTIIYGLSEKVALKGVNALQLTRDKTINLKRMIDDMRGIRSAIDQEHVPLGTIQQRSGEWITDEIIIPASQYRSLQHSLPNIFPVESKPWWEEIAKLAVEGSDTVDALNPEKTRPVIRHVAEIIEDLARSGEIKDINLLTRYEFMEMAENKWIVEVEGRHMGKFANSPRAAGVAEARTIVVKFGASDYDLTHEGIHAYAYQLQGANEVKGKNFVFGGDSKYDEIMTMLYEYATDSLAARIRGTPVDQTAYAQEFPEIHRDMSRLIEYVKTQSNTVFTEGDLWRFALTADDSTFLKSLFLTDNPEHLVNFIEGKVDYRNITKFFNNPGRRNPTSAQEGIPPLGITSFLDDLGIAAARFTRQINPSDNTVASYPPPYTEDINFFRDSENFTISIDQASLGDSSNGQVDVSTIVSNDGSVVDPEELARNNIVILIDLLDQGSPAASPTDSPQGRGIVESAYAQKLNPLDRNKSNEKPRYIKRSSAELIPLDGGENCREGCTITFPEGVVGKQTIVASLIRKKNNQVKGAATFQSGSNSKKMVATSSGKIVLGISVVPTKPVAAEAVESDEKTIAQDEEDVIVTSSHKDTDNPANISPNDEVFTPKGSGDVPEGEAPNEDEAGNFVLQPMNRPLPGEDFNCKIGDVIQPCEYQCGTSGLESTICHGKQYCVYKDYHLRKNPNDEMENKAGECECETRKLYCPYPQVGADTSIQNEGSTDLSPGNQQESGKESSSLENQDKPQDGEFKCEYEEAFGSNPEKKQQECSNTACPDGKGTQYSEPSYSPDKNTNFCKWGECQCPQESVSPTPTEENSPEAASVLSGKRK